MTIEMDDLERPDGRPASLGRVLALSGPMIVATVSHTVMQFVDFAMVSQLGTAAQAAVSPAGMAVFLPIALGIGTMTAVNTFASQALGRGRLSECSAYAWQAVWVALAGGLLPVPLALGAVPFWRWVGHEAPLQPLEVAYSQVLLLSVLPAMLAHALSNFFNGIHRPMVMMIAALASNALNVLFNWLLIFGHWGLPRLEIAGAAWGTVLGRWSAVAILAGAFLSPRVHARFASRATWRPVGRKLIGFLRVGIPAGAQHIGELSAWTVWTLWLVGQFGKVAQAASNVAMQFVHLSFMPAIGLGIALTALVGRAIGAGDREHAVHYTRQALALAMGYMGLVGASYVVFGRALMGWLSDQPEVIGLGVQILWLAAAFQLFDALGIVHSFALRGAGDTFWPAVYMVGLSWLLNVGGGIIITRTLPQLGVIGPWIMGTSCVILVGLSMWLRFAAGAWRRIDIFKTAPEPVLLATAEIDTRAPGDRHV